MAKGGRRKLSVDNFLRNYWEIYALLSTPLTPIQLPTFAFRLPPSAFPSSYLPLS